MTSFPSVSSLRLSSSYHLVGYRSTGDVWSYRVGMALLLELEIKMLLSYYFPNDYSRSSKSHKVFGLLGRLRESIPMLSNFMTSLSKSPRQRRSSITSLDYTGIRYGFSDGGVNEPYPLPEDLFELFCILADHLEYLGFR